MNTLDISELRKEREALSKRLASLDSLLDAVASFDGSGKRPGRPKGKRSHMSAAGRARIAAAQRKRWAKVKAAKKAAAKS
jgi:hypothetical protein